MQPTTHAVFDVAFKVPVPAVVGAAGITQLVWQFAARELHDIMQFVTVERTGVESPCKGGVTFGVVACASATSCAPKEIVAAAIRIAKTHMTPPSACTRFPAIIAECMFEENG